MRNSFFLFLLASFLGMLPLLVSSCKQNVNAQESLPIIECDAIEVAEIYAPYDSVSDDSLVIGESEVAEAGELGPTIISHGTINDKIHYELTDYGHLSIYGEGPMIDFEYDTENKEYLTPWRNFNDRIYSVCVDGPTSVGKGAFHGLPNLRNAVFYSPISKIGDHAFALCRNLQTVIIKHDLDYIGKYAFSQCSNLSEIEFPSQVNSYGREAFASTAFVNIDLPEGAKILPQALFYGCDNLKDVELPSTLKIIDMLAFAHCIKLKEIDLPENLKKLDFSAFQNTSIDFIAVPKSVTKIIHFGCSPNIEAITLQSTTVPNFVDISSNLRYLDDLTIYVPRQLYSTYTNNEFLKEHGLTERIKIYPSGEKEKSTISTQNAPLNNYPTNNYYPSNNPSAPASHSGHYETRQERCSSCLGKGYTEKMVWHGGDRTSIVKLTCHTCHGTGVITKREYILDY